MNTIQNKFGIVEKHIKENNVTVMIIGLGSVGTYLLDYLVSRNDKAIKVVVVGRNFAKMEKSVNIVRVAALIREINKTNIEIRSDVDLSDVDIIQSAIEEYQPDFIVNSSRAYPGLKYGSISWSNIRAYGIWTPLAIRFTKNIMDACNKAGSNAVVINTSYSDAVIPWLKSSGRAYPDFGSGNLNHLVPRIKYAVAEMIGVSDFWNIDIMFAAGHFHDVVISKEGHTEGVDIPLKTFYMDKEIVLDPKEVFSHCRIAMPVDEQRNMMNASSNYRIIDAVIAAVRMGNSQKIFSPGVFGNLGGYPVQIGYKNGVLDAWIDESIYSFEEMNKTNRASMALDGIEDVKDGMLVYTDYLIEKTKLAFDVELPKTVAFEDIDKTAKYIIDRIIIPQLKKD